MGTLKETNPSLWVKTAPPQTTFPPLAASAGDRVFDLAVVGAGITGLSTALAALEQGASVIVLEAGRICSGVTGYTTAKVTSLHGLTYAGLRKNRNEDVARLYGEANEAGLAKVREWAERHSVSCELEDRDAYTYTTDPGKLADIEAEAEVARSLGLPASFTTETELPFDVAGAVRFTGQAQFHPRLYCLGLASAISEAGGLVHERSRVVEVEPGTPCEVRTEESLVNAHHVVLATHLPFMDRGGFFAKTHPERSYAMAVQLGEGSPMPQGMYLGKDDPTRSLRTALGDRTLIVGGEGHKVGQERDTNACYERLESWAREHFAVETVEARWSAQDYVPVDGTPFIGRLLPKSNVLVATGFQKWGMTTGTVAGLMMADLAGGTESPWLEAFDSTRLKEVVTSKATYTENVDAVGDHLVGDRLRTARPAPAESLPPGEGGIVDLDGEKVAAYRSEDGQLTAVSPVCGHVGCLVSWNTAEKTWDCPCHGSRYTTAGKVIQGPSVKDLAPKSPQNKTTGGN
jgi:glycine/D-amino acid oxidase-like deaminating enzyme/nitrite reductase/ring-hydroxylating ferredoxin subunit